MRPVRPLACAIALTITFAVAGAPAYAAESDSVHYVALGDSYASGTGAGDYSGGSCYRSANAYPNLWADANDPATYTFAACSGARTDHVLNDQVAALEPATTLVSVSIGGNDAGFADVMITCTLGSNSDCVRRVDRAKAYAQTELPPKLDQVYAAITTRAPNAHVVVVGYPRIMIGGSAWWCYMSQTKRTAINGAADLLSEVTEGRATAAGLTYLDTRDDFRGHGVCNGAPWINGIVWSNVIESYHPNRAGHANGYYPAFEAVA